MLVLLADLLASEPAARDLFWEWQAPHLCKIMHATVSLPPSASPLTRVDADTAFQSSRVSNAVGCVSGAQVLVAVWRDVDAALGLTNADGLLCDTDRPLAGTRPHRADTIPHQHGCTKSSCSKRGAAAAEACQPQELLSKVWLP